jgi:hypothetical protein
VASATDGHYSAEVVFPHDGVWTIGSQHEVIMPDTDVATATVPGGVTITPSVMTERAHYEWGPIRPSFPPSAPDAAMGAPQQTPDGAGPPLAGDQDVEPASHEQTVAEPRDVLPVWVVIAGGAATVGLAVLLIRRYRRSNA